MKKTLFAFEALILMSLLMTRLYAQSKTTNYPSKSNASTMPKREFRGVWIATVDNIDWPSTKHLTPALQRNEFIRMLDNLQATGINCVIVQVRSAADAIYAKSDEPWAEWLNGQQGKAPEPFYDPLEFFVHEAHKRGMEIHAWINPYRAVYNTKHSSIEAHHITRKNSGWFFTYGTTRQFNPGIPDVRNYIVKVVMNLVKNYDIDGIHLDDYFYPYPEKGLSIQDENTFRLFNNGFSNIGDWRRNNVNLLIHALHDSIMAAKPYIKFGISPYGPWKNFSQDSAGSQTHGMNSYFNLYADTRLWVQNGWVDYINPQIYFGLNSHAVPFEPLTRWWAANTFGKVLVIGIGAFQIGVNGGEWRNPALISKELAICRNLASVQGQVYFSAQSILSNRLGFADTLKNRFYPYLALMPTMSGKDTIPPNAPFAVTSRVDREGIHLNWKAPALARDGESARYYAVYRFEDNEPVDLENPKHLLKIIFKETAYTDRAFNHNLNYFYVITALDRMQNESLGICNTYVKLN